MASRDRRGAERRGRHAETLAAWWLRLKGYSILATRVRLPTGEIDLIARRGGIIAFVEVKQRAQLSEALTAVSATNWSRISRTAELWSARRRDLRDLDWRYDLVTIVPFKRPRHYRDYWRP